MQGLMQLFDNNWAYGLATVGAVAYAVVLLCQAVIMTHRLMYNLIMFTRVMSSRLWAGAHKFAEFLTRKFPG